MTVEDKLDGLGHVITDYIGDTDLDFAVVLWQPGKQGKKESLAIASSMPKNPQAVGEALVTAASALGRESNDAKILGLKFCVRELCDVLYIMAGTMPSDYVLNTRNKIVAIANKIDEL